MKYSGIDLHSSNCVVAIIDEADRVLYRKRLPNDLSVIVGALAPYREELHSVVVESTYNWYWLVDGLMEAGCDVRLANTAQIQQYDGLKHSDDGDDAVHLAHLMRLGLLRRDTFIRRLSAWCATCCASAASSCGSARCTFCRLRTWWHATVVSSSGAIK